MELVIFRYISRTYRKLFPADKVVLNESNQISNKKRPSTPLEKSSAIKPTIIPRNQHNVSRKNISENALKVLHRLNKYGYEAYLVGGCIRDLLLGRKPKDFDISTNATPEQIQKIFRNCRLVGRRFRLAHIMFGREVIEVATFRGTDSNMDSDMDSDESFDSTPTSESQRNQIKRSQNGMLLRDNIYGNIEQDAIRRDFTVNALYYSAKDFTIRDYCNGISDLKNGIIRLIGDPETRYREDPVRMLRAVRFSAKLNMTIEPKTAKPITQLAPLLNNIPSARLFDESLKLLQSGYGYSTYVLLRKHSLFSSLFPLIDNLLPATTNSHQNSERNLSYLEKMLEQVLKNTDYRIQNDQRINPAFLLAAFLWYPLTEKTQSLMTESGLTYHDAFAMAAHDILREQCRIIAIPRRFTSMIDDIWRLQLRLAKPFGKRAYTAFEHPKFRAAYDLLELRSSIEKGELLALAKWWDEFQSANTDNRSLMVKQKGADPKKRPYNRNRRPKSP